MDRGQSLFCEMYARVTNCVSDPLDGSINSVKVLRLGGGGGGEWGNVTLIMCQSCLNALKQIKVAFWSQ